MGIFKIDNGYLHPINVAGTTNSDSVGIILKDSIYTNTGIFNGNGDGGGNNGVANLIIKSWYGVGFVDGCTGKGMTVGINCRTGTITANTFTGNLNGNATSASSVAWSGVTGKPSTFTPSSHNHTSLTGITSLDFSTHSDDGATIKTTINNTSTYLDFNLVDDGESDFFRWNFGRWDSATSSQKDVTLMTLTCAQNANTAKLVVNGTI
jgi:hypothetical protein